VPASDLAASREILAGRWITIVVATIEGSASVWPAGSAWPRRDTVRVRLAQPP
jgi:hypothetical protein